MIEPLSILPSGQKTVWESPDSQQLVNSLYTLHYSGRAGPVSTPFAKGEKVHEIDLLFPFLQTILRHLPSPLRPKRRRPVPRYPEQAI